MKSVWMEMETKDLKEEKDLLKAQNDLASEHIRREEGIEKLQEKQQEKQMKQQVSGMRATLPFLDAK